MKTYTRCLAAALAGSCVFSSPTIGAPTWSYSFNPTNSIIQVGEPAKAGLFRPADSIQISTSTGGSIRVMDVKGALVYSGAPTSLKLPVGHYFVETPGDRSGFGVLPADYAGASFIGSTADTGWHVLTNRNNAIRGQWARIGWESQWTTLEPQRGQRDWAPLDNRINQNLDKKIILMTSGKPGWVTDAEFLTAYVDYVKAMVTRYAGKIYAVEVWNEPWNGSFPAVVNNDWIATYVRLAKDVAAAVRALDPSIQIYGPNWADYRTWETRQMIEQGLLDSIDGYVWHYYDMGSQAPDSYNWDAENVYNYSGPGKSPTLFGGVREMQAMLPGKAMLVTEFGLFGSSSLGVPNTSTDKLYLSKLDWQRGMHRATKALMLYRAAGVECVIPHNFGLNAPNHHQVDEVFGWDGPVERGPHPRTTTFLMMAHLLNGASFSDYRTPGERVSLFAWRLANNSSVVFAWASEGQSVALKSNHGLAATDLFGRAIQPTALAEEPILFRSTSSDANALLTAALNALNENINFAPTFEPVSNQSVLLGQTLQFTVKAHDRDNDPLTYSVTPLPAGASLNAATGVFAWTPTATQAGSYSLTFRATDARGSSVTATTTVMVLGNLLDGLAHHWKFDEGSGSAAADSIGGAHASLVNFNFNSSSGWTSGKTGNALLFDGSNDQLSVNQTSLAVSNNFTLTAWVYPTMVSQTGNLLAIRTRYNESGIRFYLAGGQLRVEGQTPTGRKIVAFSHAPVVEREWSHVAVVYDKSTVHGYVNGAHVGSQAWDGNIVMLSTGASRIGFEYGNYFHGKLDDIMVFQRTLMEPELQTLAGVGAAPNRAPTLNPVGPKSVLTGSNLSFVISGSDPDGDALTFSASNLPSGATFDAGTRTFSWTPGSTQTGGYDVTFSVSDSSLSASEVVRITSSAPAVVNNPPVLSPIGNKSVNEGATLSFTVSGSDPDGDALTYSASNLPSGATFSASTRTFSWTPSYSQAGNYNVTFSVSDGALSASQTITITVNNVNRAPTLNAIGNKSINEGASLSFTVSGSDPDGDALTYSASNLPSGATFSASTRAFSWTPSYTQAGNYNVTFSVSDGALSASQTITITVNNVNRAPTLNAIGNKSVNTDQNLGFTINGSDPDGDALTFSASGLPSGATFSASTRAFSWTPTTAQVGNHTATFTVSDGSLTASETITISVGSVNRAPSLDPIGKQSATVGQPLTFTLKGTDPDGDNLSYSSPWMPFGATLNPTTGVFTWTPLAHQVGGFDVTFTVSDGALSDSELVRITSSAATQNQAPALNAIGDKSVNEGSGLSFIVIGSDPDGDALTYSVSGLPNGANFDASTQIFTWSPSFEQAGGYPVTFTVSDGVVSASETILITVHDVNRPPVMNPIPDQVVEEGQSLSFVVSATDPDGDPLTYSAGNLPSGATFNTGSRTFAWTPITGQAGDYSVSFTVSDGSLSGSTTASITVTVLAARVTEPTNNTPPVLTGVDILTGVAGQTITHTFTAADADGDALTFSSSDLPSGASLNSATGAFSWTPTTASGYSFTVTVADGQASHSLTIPALVVHPSYDWLAGAKLFVPHVINDNIFVFSYRRQGNTSVVFVWTRPGVNASIPAIGDLDRTTLFNQPITSNTLSPVPMLYHGGKRVSPRQAFDLVVGAIQY